MKQDIAQFIAQLRAELAEAESKPSEGSPYVVREFERLWGTDKQRKDKNDGRYYQL